MTTEQLRDRAKTPRSSAVAGHYSGSSDQSVWFRSHYEDAADEIVEFFAGDGISLKGKRVADVGCGDGITDFGLAMRAEPSSLIGYDVVPTDVDHLLSLAAEGGVDVSDGRLSDALSFVTSGETSLPAPNKSFDYVISWSAFEHILEPVPLLREIRRVLADDGVLFIQLWPFYDSAHGTHLMDWFPEGFAQYRYTDEQILATMQAGPNPDAVPGMYEAYRTLNRITADGLHAALREAGFRVVKLHLQSDAVHVPDKAADLPPSRVGICGIKLLAIKGTDRIGAPSPSPAGSGPAGAPPAGLIRRARRLVLRALRAALRRLDDRLYTMQAR